jgi:hypothetical protein
MVVVESKSAAVEPRAAEAAVEPIAGGATVEAERRNMAAADVRAAKVHCPAAKVRSPAKMCTPASEVGAAATVAATPTAATPTTAMAAAVSGGKYGAGCQPIDRKQQDRHKRSSKVTRHWTPPFCGLPSLCALMSSWKAAGKACGRRPVFHARRLGRRRLD